MNTPREGTIEQFAIELSRLLQPLQEDLSPERAISLFLELGIRLTPTQIGNPTITNALNTTVNQTSQLIQKAGDLISAISSGNVVEISSLSLEAIGLIKTIINEFTTVANAINGLGVIGFNPSNFPTQLFNYLIFNYLDKAPGLNEILEFLEILESTDFNIGSVDPNQPPFTRYTYHLNKIGGWLGAGGNELKSLYGWGTNSFTGQKLFSRVAKILSHSGVPVIFDSSGLVPRLDIVFTEVVPKLDINPRGLLATIKYKLDGIQQTFSQDDWGIQLKLTPTFPIDSQIVIQPNGNLTVRPPAGNPAIIGGDVRLQWVGRKKTAPNSFVIFGQVGGSRFQVEELDVNIGVGLNWHAERKAGEGNFQFEAQIRQCKVVITTVESDSFLTKILPSTNLETDFNLAIGFSSETGIYFVGSAVLEVQLPLHIGIGSIELLSLTLAFQAGDQLAFTTGVDLKAALGPINALVQKVGIIAYLGFPTNNSGNLGPANFSLGFKPPNGAGLSIDTGIIKGGGFLSFDPNKQEYAGALELVFSEFLTLKAIGIITTKMPDGSKGFSLLIIITAEFGTGIQLGFGFTLLAVGGLLGLNRTMRLQPLAEGVRTGAINSILFPKDIIANAPRIISDLRTIFPPEEGKFLIGPMAKLGWGTPTLISLSLGIIIEIPGNIAILGVLRVALPTNDLALIVLQVNFVGAIEFDRKRIWFFASLFESRILFMTLEGEMGVLVAFGDDANFVVTVGGFHPQFNPPPLPFPNPARIAVNYINESYARIRVMNYFAVTSNTAQIGAHAELFFGFSEFSVEGHIGFDALIQFSPFHFIIEVSASVALKAFGVGVFSISLRFSLQGSTPFRARGTGSISLLLFDISANFDITWGESRNTTLPPIDVMPILKAEFEKIENWRAVLPAANNLLVSLRKLDPAADTLVLHPVGVLKISQKAIPLDLPIDKVGNQKTNDAKQLSVQVTSSTGLGKKADAQEQFAIAQFQNMEDASKLSRPAYEPQHSGLELSVAGQQLASSRMVKRIIRYEEIIIDNNFKRFVRSFSIFVGALFGHFLAGASVSKSILSQSQREKLQPFAEKIAVQPASYAVAFQSTNKLINTEATFTSQASANYYMQQQIAIDPSMSDALHVIPSHEVPV